MKNVLRGGKFWRFYILVFRTKDVTDIDPEKSINSYL